MNALQQAIVGTTLAIASGFAAANPVQLMFAQSYVNHSTTTNGNIQAPSFEAVAANLASSQQVFVHIKTPAGNWTDVPMSYARAAGSGFGVWSIGINNVQLSAALGTTPINLTFDIKLVANGQTYWDNNSGSDYQVAADSGSYLPSFNVFDASYTPQVCQLGGNPGPGTPVSGNITVRNIAYAKSVNIVYSTDNWKTTHTVPASYSATFWANYRSNAGNPNQYGFEQWSYNFNIGTAQQMQYAVAYTVNGQTYWDNNFGQNYSVTGGYCQ